MCCSIAKIIYIGQILRKGAPYVSLPCCLATPLALVGKYLFLIG